MQVIGCQLDIAWEDKPANYRRVRELLRAAPIQPGALIALPEMFSTGYSMNVEGVHEGTDRGGERLLAELAREHRAHVIGGVVTRTPNGRGRNEAIVCRPDGSEVARYAKRYPLTLAGEAEHYEAGDASVVFDCGPWRVAPLICYDLRFPELFRELVRRGVHLFVVIANFPAVRQPHWLALLAARAIENQAYVLGVNRTGRDPSHDYVGGSVLFDPQGNRIADAGEAEGLLEASLDLPALEQYRDTFPALRDMR